MCGKVVGHILSYNLSGLMLSCFDLGKVSFFVALIPVLSEGFMTLTAGRMANAKSLVSPVKFFLILLFATRYAPNLQFFSPIRCT